jgi:hypothetical protein
MHRSLRIFMIFPSLFPNLAPSIVRFLAILSFTYTVLTFGDAQGDDEDHSLNMDHGFHSKLPPGILPHGLPTVKEVAPAITPQEQKKDDVKVGE